MENKTTTVSLKEMIGYKDNEVLNNEKIIAENVLRNKPFIKYAEKLKHPKWQRKRLEIMNRDNFKCVLCNDSETTLNVHHLAYSANPWEIENEKLITLCEHCHEEVEFLKLQNIQFDINNIKIYKLIDFDNNRTMIIHEKNNFISFIRFNSKNQILINPVIFKKNSDLTNIFKDIFTNF